MRANESVHHSNIRAPIDTQGGTRSRGRMACLQQSDADNPLPDSFGYRLVHPGSDSRQERVPLAGSCTSAVAVPMAVAAMAAAVAAADRLMEALALRLRSVASRASCAWRAVSSLPAA